MTRLRVLCLALLVTALPAASQVPPAAPAPATSAAQAPAGEITLLVGRATAASPAGVFRNLAKGAPVYRGDVISTAPDSYLNIKFADRGLTFLKPNTLFEIEDFRYTPPASPPAPAPQAGKPAVAPVTPPATPGASIALFRLLRGGLRTVTGLVGKDNREQYRLRTPVATIGIRGTDYFAYLCDEKCRTDPVLAAELPAGFDAGSALVAGVGDGSIQLSFKCPVEANSGKAAPDANCGASLKKGQHLAVAKNGDAAAFSKPPQFLQDDPFLDPQSCAK